MLTQSRKYIIAVAIPTLILTFMLVIPLLTMLFGKEINLQTIPRDPRDVFRGDYVVLNYNINTVSQDKISPDLLKKIESYSTFKKVKRNQLYAELEKNGEYYDVKYLSETKPSNGIYIRCKLDNDYYWNGPANVRVNYGLDKFFVSENTGLKLEEKSRTGNLIANIKTWNGYTLLSGVKVE